jgi:chemotaxis protein histidine kinase CheA
MGNRETILSFIQTNGPVLPSKIAKLIKTNQIFASAHLSELVDSKKLKISNTKIGGSPVYYLEGQEARLQELYDNLNPKDKEAYNQLKQNKVLKDDELSPLTRVSMRSIKDFAVPIYVTYENQKILFWKWYLLSNEEVQDIIGSYLKPLETKEQEKIEAEKEVTKQLEQKKEEEKRKQEEQKKLQEEKIKLEKDKKKIEEEKRRLEEQKKIELEKRKIEEEKKRIAEEKRRLEFERKQQQESFEKEKKRIEESFEKEKKKIEAIRKTQEHTERIEKHKKHTEEQKNLDEIKTTEPKKEQEDIEKIEEKNIKEIEGEKDEFLDQLNSYFAQSNIEVEWYEIIKKKSEIDFILKIPSVVGALDYYCKAKNKKSITENDLASAFVQGQLKKLPVLILMTGSLNKKAQDLLTTEFKKGLFIKKLD